MRSWRNRHTRTFEGRVQQWVRVQVPSTALHRALWLGFFFAFIHIDEPPPQKVRIAMCILAKIQTKNIIFPLDRLYKMLYPVTNPRSKPATESSTSFTARQRESPRVGRRRVQLERMDSGGFFRNVCREKREPHPLPARRISCVCVKERAFMAKLSGTAGIPPQSIDWGVFLFHGFPKTR